MAGEFSLTQVLASVAVVGAAIGSAGKWMFVTKRGCKSARSEVLTGIQKDMSHIKETISSGDVIRQEQIKKRDAMDKEILLHIGKVDEYIRTHNGP